MFRKWGQLLSHTNTASYEQRNLICNIKMETIDWKPSKFAMFIVSSSSAFRPNLACDIHMRAPIPPEEVSLVSFDSRSHTCQGLQQLIDPQRLGSRRDRF